MNPLKLLRQLLVMRPATHLLEVRHPGREATLLLLQHTGSVANGRCTAHITELELQSQARPLLLLLLLSCRGSPPAGLTDPREPDKARSD